MLSFFDCSQLVSMINKYTATYKKKSKVGDCSRGRPEGSLFQ